VSWIASAAVGLALIAGVIAPAANARALSPGCAELNDPKYDSLYIQDIVIDSFYAFEEIVVEAGPPDDLGPNEGSMFLAGIFGPYPGTLRYVTTAEDATRRGFSWGASGISGFNATWSVSCQPIPGGFISGTVTGDVGDSLPAWFEELTQGKVDVWTEFDEFVGTWEINGANGGTFTTGWLPEGWYYVLLYNGDDDDFVDFFPEWYPDTPLYKSTPSNLVHVHDGEVGVDAELQLGFLDMWDSVFLDDIAWMQFSGITRGCGNNLYCTTSSVTREQMAAFLVRALGLTDDGGGDLFTDDDGSIFEGDIDRLATAGITKGCNPPDNTRFCPDSKVTRGQMAAFLVRALGYVDDGGGDHFTDDDGSVFESDIDRLATAGVTRGCNPPENDRFCPDDSVTRGQMAAFLHRALGGVLYPQSVVHQNGQDLNRNRGRSLIQSGRR
jgi:hypothetical protein